MTLAQIVARRQRARSGLSVDKRIGRREEGPKLVVVNFMSRQGGGEGSKGDEATQQISLDGDTLSMRPRIGSRDCVADMRRCTAARPVEDNSVSWRSSANQSKEVVAPQELSTAHR